MTARVGALGIEVLYQDIAPATSAQIGAMGLEVLYRDSLAPPPSGVDQPVYLSRRRRIRTNQLIT